MNILVFFFVISILACHSIFSLLLSKNDTIVHEISQIEELRTLPLPKNVTNENPTEKMVLVPSTEEMEFEMTNMSTLHYLNTTSTDGTLDEIFDPEETTTLVPSTERNETSERKLPSPSFTKSLIQGTLDEILDSGKTTLVPSTEMNEIAERKLPSRIFVNPLGHIVQGTLDAILDPEQTTTLVSSTERNEIAVRKLPSPIFAKPLGHIVQGTLDKILDPEQTTTVMPSTEINDIAARKLPSLSFTKPLENIVQGISNKLNPHHNSEPILAKLKKDPGEEEAVEEQTKSMIKKEVEEEMESEKEKRPKKKEKPEEKKEPEEENEIENESEPEEKEESKEEKESKKKLIPRKEKKTKKIKKSKLPLLGIFRMRRLGSNNMPSTRQISLPNIPVISTLIRIFWAVSGTIGSILNDLAAIYNYFYNMHAKAVYEI